MNSCRFACYDYKGNPRRFFLVEHAELGDDDAVVSPLPSHHVFVFDRSGSMYYDIAATRQRRGQASAAPPAPAR